jgi:hypothetical protein
MFSISQQIVSRHIDQALTKHHVATNSRIRAEIEAHVDWSTIGLTSVSVCVNDNRILPLDVYLDELRRDPRYSQDFPPEPRRVSRGDPDKLREHFDEIRTGSVVVVD